jgi:hypothetical protein
MVLRRRAGIRLNQVRAPQAGIVRLRQPDAKSEEPLQGSGVRPACGNHAPGLCQWAIGVRVEGVSPPGRVETTA